MICKACHTKVDGLCLDGMCERCYLHDQITSLQRCLKGSQSAITKAMGELRECREQLAAANKLIDKCNDDCLEYMRQRDEARGKAGT